MVAAARRAALPLLLLAAAAILIRGAAAQLDVPQEETPVAGRVTVSTSAEAEVASQLLKAIGSLSKEVVTGKEDDYVVAASAPTDVDTVNITAVTQKIFATALATWQMGVWNAPSNRGLIPRKFTFYDRDHYYQIPKDPVGTLVMFHGCNHDASGSWPYHPTLCPECLGLPEEVAHLKIALSRGYAVLAVESRNRTFHGRCFSSNKDPLISDQWQAPYIIQNFLYENQLQDKPIYTLGISAGAAFAVKIPKTFYDDNFVIKVTGVISEVNAIAWDTWGMENLDGTLRYPGFPATAFIAMERDPPTNQLIVQSVNKLREHGVNSDFVMVRPRAVTPDWFYIRSPVITVQQSAEIVKAMHELGFINKNGWLVDDPRVGDWTPGSKLRMWNEKLVKKLPWLHMRPKDPPMLSVLSDRSTIFEEMNVAYALHEGIADHLLSCLVWLQSNGTLDLKELSQDLAVTRLRDLTADRVYDSPPPPARPRPPPSPPSALLKPKTVVVPKPEPPAAVPKPKPPAAVPKPKPPAAPKPKTMASEFDEVLQSPPPAATSTTVQSPPPAANTTTPPAPRPPPTSRAMLQRPPPAPKRR